jgi:hypothetical protein
LGALPDPQAIATGKEHAVPGPIDLQYAVASALVQHVSRLVPAERDRAIPHVLGYARRFPQRELGVMLVMDLQRASPTPLYQHAGFAEWADALGNLMAHERA